MLQTSALESTRDAWGVCVIAGWTEREAMSVKVEKLLMGRTLTGTYFGGKCEEAIFFFGSFSETHSVLNLQVWKNNRFNKTREKSLLVFFFPPPWFTLKVGRACGTCRSWLTITWTEG